MTGIALIGAGIFAREEHLPAIEATKGLTLKAIYSRSQASAEALAGNSPSSVDVYFDKPEVTGKSLDDLLRRDDIAAVVIAIPITVQPPAIKKALKAGKHVLSEKPIAKDVASAKDLISLHEKLSQQPIWAVGENLRFVEAIVHGADKVKEVGGNVVTFSMKMFTLVNDKDKFFNTEWRKIPEYQGGFLLDGGVHFVAALRLLLNAAGEDIKHLAAFTTLLRPELLPVDTVHAILATNTGRSGTFSVSFGTEFKSGFEIEVVTTEGAVTVTPTEVSCSRRGADVEKKAFGFSAGVKPEMEVFSQSLQGGKVDPRQSPAEALRDLEILEGMLVSGERQSHVKLDA